MNWQVLLLGVFVTAATATMFSIVGRAPSQLLNEGREVDIGAMFSTTCKRLLKNILPPRLSSYLEKQVVGSSDSDRKLSFQIGQHGPQQMSGEYVKIQNQREEVFQRNGPVAKQFAIGFQLEVLLIVAFHGREARVVAVQLAKPFVPGFWVSAGSQFTIQHICVMHSAGGRGETSLLIGVQVCACDFPPRRDITANWSAHSTSCKADNPKS